MRNALETLGYALCSHTCHRGMENSGQPNKQSTPLWMDVSYREENRTEVTDELGPTLQIPCACPRKPLVPLSTRGMFSAKHMRLTCRRAS